MLDAIADTIQSDIILQDDLVQSGIMLSDDIVTILVVGDVPNV